MPDSPNSCVVPPSGYRQVGTQFVTIEPDDDGIYDAVPMDRFRNRELFDELAAFNADRHRCFVFDTVKRQRMEIAQALFDLLQLADLCADHDHVRSLPDGGYLVWDEPADGYDVMAEATGLGVHQ